MDARVQLLRAVENGPGVEVALGVVHDLQENFSLARQAHAALGERFLQTAGAIMGVDSFAGGNSMCGSGHDSARGFRGQGPLFANNRMPRLKSLRKSRVRFQLHGTFSCAVLLRLLSVDSQEWLSYPTFSAVAEFSFSDAG
jgi:hypothetical protein